MNRIYKVIWSKVKNCYIVVSEIAKSHSKPVSTKLNAGKTVAAVLAVAALCAGMTTSVMAADQYYSVDDFGGRLASMGNKDNSGAKGIGSLAAGVGASVQSDGLYKGATATVVGALNTVAIDTSSNTSAYDGVANSIVGVANATQNANATLIFGAGNAVTNSYADVDLNLGNLDLSSPVALSRQLGAAVGTSGGQVLVIGGANSVDYARFSAVTGVSNTLNGADGNTSDYNFITGAKNTLTNTDSTYVIGSKNTVSDGSSNVVIGDNRKLTSTTGNVVIGSADDEMETTVSDATILGHNANATVADGVALGSKSVASVAKGVVGTVPTGTTVSDTDKATATWTSTLGAISVGDTSKNLTRQITGVAAGTQATDAVNVAQLNAVNTKVDNNAIHFFSVRGLSSQDNYSNSAATGEKSIAIGASTRTQGHIGTALGSDNTANAWGSTVIGNGSGTTYLLPNSMYDPIPFVDGQESGFSYTFKRDDNGNFIDTGLKGGYSTTLGASNTVMTSWLKSVAPLDGFGNTLVGGFNETDNANGVFIFGWQNEIKNSYFTNDANLPNNISELDGFHSDGFGGSVVAIGMDNTVDGAQHSYIMGTANTVNGKVTRGTVEEVATDNIVIGDNHKVDNASHTVILGSADTETTTDQDGVVVVGHNANATTADGVALGSNSVASVASGVAGTVPTGTTVSDTDKASATWTSTLGAVSVGDSANNLTRQITGVAAGTQATDAVNVAQLNAVNTVVNNLTTTVDANKIHFFAVNSGTSGTNYNNDGAKGTDSIAIGKASTAADNSIAIGNGASVSDSNGGKGSGDIAIGNRAQINNYVDQSASIAIGQNAQIDNMTGMQEYIFSLGQTTYNPEFRPDGSMVFKPEDPSKVATAIAIGENTFVRTGGLMIGTHNYRGVLGDVDVDSANIRATGVNVNSTTLGTNSYNSGAFATIVGAYSIASGNYASGGGQDSASKNLGATIVGSLNSVESSTATSNQSGMANSVVGVANRTFNSNGSLIFGAGNEITNSVVDISAIETSNITSAKDLQTNLIKGIKDSNSGGATLAIGGGNMADYTQQSALIGVNNTLTGTESGIAQYNALTGFNNTATGVTNVTVTGTNNTVSDSTSIVNLGNENAVSESNNTILLGDNRTVEGSDNSIILGSANKSTSSTLRAAAATTLTTEADNVVVMGYNANATVDDGVALGSNSVASVDKGVDGYNPSTKKLTGTAWTSTLGSVAVGDVSNDLTRQITGVAAGTEDTDAVNVAQLKANKVDLKAGDKVTITSSVADDGATTYTVASTDTYTESGTYDADSKKIKFTQNDTTKNYEVDLSTLVDGIDKGLNFAGDSGDAINKKLDETLDVVGGAKGDLTTENIGVVSEDGKLNVRLAKDLTNLNSVKVGDAVTLGTTGLAITNGPSVTTAGIDAAGKTITNVAAGTADTDAVNVSQLNANKIHYFHVNSTANGTNYNNDGAKGTESIAIGKSSTSSNNSIAIGQATIGNGSAAGTNGGDVAIGNGAVINNYSGQGGGIAIGYKAHTENMAGQQERLLGFAQNGGETGVTGVAIGRNAYARSGSTMIGNHNYRGALGDVTINTEAASGMSQPNLSVLSTTVGTNSFSAGAMTTVTGAYSIATSDYQGLGGLAGIFDSLKATKNFGATVTGSLNSIESATASSTVAGVANSIVGVGNRAANTNGTLIFGAGNEVTNSITDVVVPMYDGAASAKELQTQLIEAIKDSNSGGSTLVMGGGNKADYTQQSAIIGVNNTLTGTSSNISQYDYITGFNNTGTNVDNVTIIGTNRTVSDASNSVVIGAADSAMTSSASDAVTLGRNANTTVDGGVALGSNSVASVDKGVAGYDVETEKASTETSIAWKSTSAAVSVGDTANNITRQITGVAAGMQDTDAVNVAQLKQVAEAASEAGNTTLKFTGDDKSDTETIARGNGETLSITGGATAFTEDDNIGVVKEGDSALKIRLAKDLTGLNSVKIGDDVTLSTTGLTITGGPSVTTTGINAGSKTITNVAAGVNATDAVNVSQLKANKVTVKAGTNVTVTPTTETDSSTTYTIASKDTYTTAGTYDKAGKKITFTQNDTDKNYEVDVSGLVDGISEDIDKGLNFAGDSGDAINKKLDETLDVVGGAKGDLTTGNIGVVSEDGKLNVRLAEDLTGLNSVAVGDSVTLGATGLTITGGPSVTTTGINAGSKTVTNVAAGTADTDAVNVSQLKANKVAVEAGDNITVTPTTATDGSTTYKVASKDTFVDSVSFANNTLTITRNDKKSFEVENIATTDDITGKNSKVSLNFAGDKASEVVNTKSGGTLNITGGATDFTEVDNIGVVKTTDDTLKVQLAKDLNGLNSVRIGGKAAGEGIYIAKQTVTYTKDGADGKSEEGNYITGLGNTTWNPKADGIVSGRAATEDQLKSVYDTINSSIEANKVTGSRNITVSEDNQVSLNNNITLGSDTDKAKQVNIDGDAATITAGDGANKVVVDGTNGQVTIGDTTNGGIVMGNQTDVVGTKSDNTTDTQSGHFITGLDNTTWDPANNGIVEDRAATEGQLKDIADKISDIDTAVKSTSRVFESDSGADAQVTRKSTDPMKLKGGAAADNLSDNNIGVVNNSDNTGFDIKLSKDIKDINTIEVNNKITIGTGDNQTVIEGDTINTGSVTTGNTTINNDGLTIVNEDSSKNITINNNNVNMGGNVIKNIGEGTDPTDAVNKTQFDRAINNIGTGMNQINNRVNKLDTRISRVGAGAAALAALHPLEFSPEAKWEVTAGVGNYRGANAIALGAFYRPNFDTMFSIGTSYGGGENMINAGVTWRIGEGETKVYPSKTVMAQEIDDLKSVVSEQQDQIEELKKLVNSLINK